MKQIIWFCWPEEYKNSWVGRYSDIYITELKKDWINIQEKRISIRNKVLRLIYQFLIIPIKIILIYRKQVKIFRDEWMLIYTLFPFFPYKNSIYIIHDIRDFKLSTNKQNLIQKMYFYLLKKSYKNLRKINKIITPSQFTKNNIENLLNIHWRNIHVIYNPFDFNIFKKNEEHWLKNRLLDKYKIRSDKKIILNIWSEESRKNIITILKSMKDLDDYIFIKIWKPIIKQNREEHLKYIKENNLKEKVFFIDYIEDTSDLVKFYSIADIFLFPSLFEWFWRPPIEAQACWCLVISSDKWWLKEVLENSCIILENPENTTEIIEKINKLDKHKREKIIQLWLDNTKKFDLQKNINYFIKIINNNEII